MAMTYSSTASSDVASYGGFVDALGGIATIVLAIIALAGVKPEILVSIATVVFGAALLIQGGAMLTEFALIESGPETESAAATGGSLSALFLVGFAGIVLGVLALVGDCVRRGAGHLKLSGVAATDVALRLGAIPNPESDVAV
jgi:hypothetical protein